MTITMCTRFSTITALLVAGTALGAQQPVERPAAPVAGQGQTAPAQTPSAPPFSYDAEGRRDPFVSLLTRGTDPKAPTSRPSGLPGLTVAEITVKGIVRDRSGFIAMIQGPDAKTYIVRAGETLMDGSVKSIFGDTVVFLENVTDPLSPVKQREIRKAVRATDGGRG